MKTPLSAGLATRDSLDLP